METTTMKITEDHIKLLAGMARFLETEETFGFVPEFNGKRPFGNSMRPVVAEDAWCALGRDINDFDYDDEDQHARVFDLLRECTPALRAILKSPDMSKFVGTEFKER